jgi:DNA-binding NarL/FixJ family response regulator
MTTRLTDDDLRRLKIKTAGHPAGDERVRALLSEIVASCPLSKIHWLEESREDILAGWLAERLLGGRLQAMIDKARHVGALRKIAEEDLHQYAAIQRRGELPTRLFKRLDKLLRANPQRYSPLMPSVNAGSTYWTLTSRPANAIFSERDHELLSHVFAVGLNTLEESVDAGKQTQFLIHSELDRYTYEMLERSARGLSLDQLVRGLVLAYALDPQMQEFPDADALEEQLGSSATTGVENSDVADPPDAGIETAARTFVADLTPRQAVLLRGILHDQSQQVIANELGCSTATLSAEKDAMAQAITALVSPEERTALIKIVLELLGAKGENHAR